MKKKFFNQEEIKIKEYENYNTIQFDLDIPLFFGFKSYKDLDNEILDFYSELDPSDEPTLFKIKGDFDVLEQNDAEENIYFLVAVVNIFVGHMIYHDEEMEREQRLGVPKSLNGLNLTTMTLKEVINKKIKFPIFSIEVLDKNNNSVYEVFHYENTNTNPN